MKPTDEHWDWGTGTDDDAEYRAFVEGVTVTREEMEVLIKTPSIGSIEEAKRYLRVARETSAPVRRESGAPGREHAVARACRRIADAVSSYHLWNHGHHHANRG